MKKFGIAAILTLAACTTYVPPAKNTEVSYRTVQSGNAMQVQSSQPRAVIAESEKEFEIYWSTVIGSSTAPKIDFKKEQPILLCAGAVPTGGHDIRIQSIHRDGPMVAVVAPIVGPAPDAIVTQVISFPYVVIAIPTKQVRQVRWLDGAGRDIELSTPGGVQYQ